jgi:glycosyltransferase involved in cell wall biosynthesis
MRIVYHHRTRSTDAQRIHIQEIVRAFEELGHTVEVVSLVSLNTAPEDARRDAGEAGWKKLVRKIPYAYEAVQLAYNLVGIPMLLVELLRRKTDFIYERYALFNFTGVVAARLCGIPLVLEVNSPFALEQSRDGDIRSPRFAQWTESVICGMAAHVVVVSTPLARVMQAAGVPAGKIEVMSNGVSLERFRPGAPSAELRGKLGIRDEVIVGFVGWFRKWHGLELLLDAFHRSHLAGRGVKIVLIGDGPAMPDLQAFVAEHGLNADVLFTGPLPHAEVPPYLDLIDIAVQPAANEYCCPMKILEYMALGKPIIAPAQENIQELLTEKEAIFFTPRDADSLATALEALAHDRERSQEMGRNARAAIHKRGFLWTANAQRVLVLAAPRESGQFCATTSFRP